MYSGSTFNKYSGQLLGAHQKIDRVARRHLERLLPHCQFPSAKAILQFEGHYRKLVEVLKAGDRVRAAFEAAWLAHAVVDGLTPAHHYPYAEKLVELREDR